MSRCVYDDKYFQAVAPEFPLNCRDDGGHLILIKKEKVTDRSDLSYQEAIDFMRITVCTFTFSAVRGSSVASADRLTLLVWVSFGLRPSLCAATAPECPAR
jgi:hypothetical protein